jgi:hypothetical protein
MIKNKIKTGVIIVAVALMALMSIGISVKAFQPTINEEPDVISIEYGEEIPMGNEEYCTDCLKHREEAEIGSGDCLDEPVPVVSSDSL